MTSLETEHQTCRTCVKNAGTLPIFGDKTRPDISQEISTFGSVLVGECDGLPQYICTDCFDLLQSAITFRKITKRSDGILRRRRRRKGVPADTNLQHKLIKTENAGSTSETEMIIEKIEISVDVTENMAEYTNINDENISEEIIEEANVDTDLGNKSDSETIMLIVSEDNNAPHTCKLCKTSYVSSAEYEEHCNTTDHKRNYVKSFLPKRTLPKQTVLPKDLQCDICNRYYTKLHYTRHMKSQHNIQLETSRSKIKKECPTCKKMYHPSALLKHIKKAHTENMIPAAKIPCPICEKPISKDFFRPHMERHQEGDTKKYICDQCGRKFFFKNTLYNHQLIHKKDLPHQCEYCPYRGRTKGLLRIHVRTHTGDYPYKCTQCDTRCITKSNLDAHMRRHRGPVDFKCDKCDRGFYSKLQLERHISVTHLGIKSHICDICGATFGYRKGLKCHEIQVHKRPKEVGKAKAAYLQLDEASGSTEDQASITNKTE